jgi:hypothetical protein
MPKQKDSPCKYVLLMKAGPYCGYSLEEIVKIKTGEQEKLGKFYWGYSGVFCRPNILHAFISQANADGEKIHVLLSETKSSYTSDTVDRFTQFSKDRDSWEKLPEEVLLVGNTQKPHFAITAKNLKSEAFELDLSQYCTTMGAFKNPNKYLDEYFRYRVDKVCGYYLPQKNKIPKMVKINYSSELEPPYSIYIK